jgi:hypothetical protein
MKPLLAFLLLAAFVGTAVGAYALGYADGKLAEEVNNLFKRFDAVIRRIKP